MQGSTAVLRALSLRLKLRSRPCTTRNGHAPAQSGRQASSTHNGEMVTACTMDFMKIRAAARVVASIIGHADIPVDGLCVEVGIQNACGIGKQCESGEKGDGGAELGDTE